MVKQTADIHDLVIIGAGPVGATLALVCARLGLHVALVDARPPKSRRRSDTRNFAIVQGSWNLLSHTGITDTLIDGATPLNGLEAEDGARHWFGTPSTHFSGHDLPGETDSPQLGWMVEAEPLQAALDDAIATAPEIRVFTESLFESAERDDASIGARLSTGKSVTARILVGCDGLNSPVRHWAGIGVEGRDYGKSVFAANVKLSRPHFGVARQLFTPEGPFATLPLKGDRANLAWYLKRGAAETLAARPRDEIEAELNDRFAGFAGKMSLDGPPLAYPLRLQIANAMIAERVALVGDAARRINPLAGQGLNLGFKDVAALAQTCSDQVRAGLDPGDGLALQAYSNWRRFDGNATALGMDMIDRVFSNDSAVLKPLRSLALIAADRIDPIRRAMARQASAAQPSLPAMMQAPAQPGTVNL